MECIPSVLGKTLSETLDIPVIGIGAGSDCDAQVLVMHDMIGVTPGKPAKFVRNFLADGITTVPEAFEAYVKAVKDGSFPGPEHCFV